MELSHAIPNNNLTSLIHFCDALKLHPLNHYLSCQLLKFNKLCKRDVCKSNIEYNKLKPGSQYLALRPEVNVNVRANARIELGSILAFVVRLH